MNIISRGNEMVVATQKPDVAKAAKDGEKALISLAELRGHLPVEIGRSAVLRWVTHGIGMPDGKLLRLAAVRVGVKWFTTLEAYAKFSKALNESRGPESLDALDPNIIF